jgi:Flp pilus assembly protein TadG
MLMGFTGLTAFRRDDRGGVAILFGLVTITLFAMIGAALDYGKWHNANSRVERAMDSALLAAGRQFQTDPDNPQAAIDAASTYFNQFALDGVVVEGLVANFNVTQTPLGIEGSATGAVKTPFLSLVNIKTLDVSMTSNVEFGVGGGSSGTKLEVSLMLDVTESMCSGAGPCTTSTKMDAMKTAAKDLVKVVLGSNSTTEVARVALVPFATNVRVDDEMGANARTLMKKLTDLDPTWSGYRTECSNWVPASTGSSEVGGSGSCSATVDNQYNNIPLVPCVTDRTGPGEFTDAAPGPNMWLNAIDGGRAPTKSWDSSDTPITTDVGTAADPTYSWNYTTDGLCWDNMSPNYVVPLTSSRATLDTRIDALEAYGSTAGALGTAWAWYLISPNWSTIWTGASAPGPYSDLTTTTSSGAPKLRKIAVLMTDGDFNTYRSWKNYDPVTVSNNAKAICANMKAEGVEVFTVGFDLDALPGAERARAIDTLQSCGTDVEHFYNSLDAAQLQTAFRDIALKLSQLYLAK